MTACTEGKLPPSVTAGASVLLPKTARPASWSDTRPITLSSAILKWLAQLLLLRGSPLLQEVCQRQWASKGKQGVELILAMRKLARVAHEWRTPFYVVKIDIAKAFDSVAQEKLADLVMRKIAQKGSMPWEARLWLSLLEARGKSTVLWLANPTESDRAALTARSFSPHKSGPRHCEWRATSTCRPAWGALSPTTLRCSVYG